MFPKWCFVIPVVIGVVLVVSGTLALEQVFAPIVRALTQAMH